MRCTITLVSGRPLLDRNIGHASDLLFLIYSVAFLFDTSKLYEAKTRKLNSCDKSYTFHVIPGDLLYRNATQQTQQGNVPNSVKTHSKESKDYFKQVGLKSLKSNDKQA